ncbi:MAG: flagellar motor protein [Clostridiales bacterium]|nr:flagellar motor protein [Clostridiales bacterium]MCF8021771.1 flagellar motor protein [Clostridiales bacterium]
MEVTAVIAFIFALFSLVGGFLMEGGTIGSLVQISAAIIVFGGTIGATAFSFSWKELLMIPRLLRIGFFSRSQDSSETIDTVVKLADEARREGLLYLENKLSEIEDPFLSKGIQLVVDGTDPEVVKNILETEIYNIEERHKIGSSIFNTAGGYAPTMGIIGTVMGLVHVLGSMENPDKLAPAIAVAFMATLYGVVSANILWFPLGAKLENLSKKEILMRELVMEGIVSLQAGYNPVLIRERLTAYLAPASRETEDAGLEDEM